MATLRRKNRPRVYITLKDAVTGEVRGVTINETNLPDVLKKLDETFAENDSTKPSRRATSPKKTPASTEPLPETASAGA